MRSAAAFLSFVFFTVGMLGTLASIIPPGKANVNIVDFGIIMIFFGLWAVSCLYASGGVCDRKPLQMLSYADEEIHVNHDAPGTPYPEPTRFVIPDNASGRIQSIYGQRVIYPPPPLQNSGQTTVEYFEDGNDYTAQSMFAMPARKPKPDTSYGTLWS